MTIAKKLFISYSWKNEKDVEDIDSDFKSIGINLTRDIRDIKHYQSIKAFMKTIKTADYVLMIISDSYLKSKNCMYEVLELLKEDNYKDKILPILLNDCNEISGIKGKIKYIKFWQNEYDVNKKFIESVDSQNTGELNKDLNIIESISRNISNFLSVITDMKHSSLNKLKEENYKPVLDYIGFDDKSIESKLLKIRAIKNIEYQNLAIENLQSKDSKNSKLFFFKGRFEYERENYIKAEVYYTESIRLNSDNFLAYNNRGIVKGILGQKEEAIIDFTEAIRLNPHEFQAYYNRGIVKAALGQLDEALKDYNDALELNPFESRIYNNRGIVKAALGQLDEAIKDYNDAIEFNPANWGAYQNRAIAKSRLGKDEEAAEDLTESVRLKKESSFSNPTKYFL